MGPAPDGPSGTVPGAGGTFIGDAVMAVWGTPAAAEGDAERAVRAALDLMAVVGQFGKDTKLPGPPPAPPTKSAPSPAAVRRRAEAGLAAGLTN